MDRQAERASEAATLLKEGVLAFEQGDYKAALERLRRAYELAPNYRSAGVLGQLELELGRHQLAATHLDESVRTFPQGKDPESLSRVMDGLEQARRHVATLRVQGARRDAELWVDGKKFASAPITHDLFLEPGEHEIELRASGFEAAKDLLYLPAGATHQLRLRLKRPGDSERPSAHALATADDEASQGSNVIALTAASLSVLGVGGAVGLQLWANAARNERNDLRNQLAQNRSSCDAESPSPSCVALSAARDRVATRSTWAQATFVGSTVMGVIAVLAFTIGDEGKAEPGGNVALVPLLDPTSAGATVQGAF